MINRLFKVFKALLLTTSIISVSDQKENENLTNLIINKNDSLVIKFKIRPGNGYMWYVTESKGVKLVKDVEFKPSVEGDYEQQVFKFYPIEHGEFNVKFVYRRYIDLYKDNNKKYSVSGVIKCLR